MSQAPRLTDRAALAAHRRRAARLGGSDLHEIAAVEIEERLRGVKKRFTKIALVGHAPEALRARFPDAVVAEDAERLALKPGVHDLVIHAFGLHWADDPVGQMVQSRLALEPDGLFIGVMFGGRTLFELRAALAEAETSLRGGLSPRVAPLADVRALGDLLLRAGLALPVADTLTVERRYGALQDLAGELRRMGETNALAARETTPLTLRFWSLAETIYRANFSAQDDAESLAATFELVFLTGWAPDESQPKPLRPGSAATRLADALGVPELPAGESAAPKRR